MQVPPGSIFSPDGLVSLVPTSWSSISCEWAGFAFHQNQMGDKTENSLQSLNDLVDVNFIDAYGGEMHDRVSLFPVFRREPHFLP